MHELSMGVQVQQQVLPNDNSKLKPQEIHVHLRFNFAAVSQRLEQPHEPWTNRQISEPVYSIAMNTVAMFHSCSLCLPSLDLLL